MRQWGGRAQMDVKRKEIKETPWRDQQGMALLITVLTVSLLVAVTLQFHKTTWQQFVVSNNYKVKTQLETIADSGVNIALALLQYDKKENQFDSLQDNWATLDKERFEGLFSAGSLHLKVIDLSGRLQVNSLVQSGENSGAGGGSNTTSEIRRMFLNLLMSGAFQIEDETEAQGIIDALIDWIDKDDQESDLGAESSYYQSLEKPYSCRNGPVRSIEELLLVKGITPALLFGTAEKRGLADYLTVTGDNGKVNINTAPLLVIKSMDSLLSDDLLEKLAEYRSEKTNEENLANAGWYREVEGWPGDIVLNENVLTVSSSNFEIVSTGEFDTLSRSVLVFVERSSESGIKLLEKKME